MFGSKLFTFSHIFPWGFLLQHPLSSMRAQASTIPVRKSRFELLPTEILYMIIDHSDYLSAIFLKNTSRRFKQFVDPGPNSFSRCKKWTIMCRLETDWLRQLPHDKWPATLLCTLCKCKRPVNEFASRMSWRTIISSSSILDIRPIQRDPTRIFCTRRPFTISWGLRNHPRRREWVVSRRLICTHCRTDRSSEEQRGITGCDQYQCSLWPRTHMEVFMRTGALERPSVAAKPYMNGLSWSRDLKKFFVSEVGSRLSQR